MFARLAAFLAILALTVATAAASAHAMRMTFAGGDMPAMAHMQSAMAHGQTLPVQILPADAAVLPDGPSQLAHLPDMPSPDTSPAEDCCGKTRTAGPPGDICALSCAVLAGALPPEGAGPGAAHGAEGHALPGVAVVGGRNPELADRPPRAVLL
ncbi:MAG: hypothetical protein IAE87_19615 [Rhodobacteraceae bacterium]|jgi:hypothetical protein|nr:hypothetical protein [Paracoccaceae bacterium]